MVRPAWLRRLLGATLAIGLSGAATSAFASCDRLLPSPNEMAAHQRRDITAADLLGLRDLGFPDAAVSEQTPFGVAPGGRSLAFVVNRADVATNSYCRALVVLPLDGGPPRIVDRGGEFLQLRTAVRGLLAEAGVTQVETPAWSPDGKRIAYLKRTDGVTRIWLVDVQAAKARVIATPPVDVENVAWSTDGRTILYQARSHELAVRRSVDEEGLTGWLYDDRMTPNAGARPRLREADVPIETLAIDPETNAIHPADAVEQATMGRVLEQLAADAAPRSGERFSLAEPSSFSGPRRLVVDRNGRQVFCNDPACSGSLAGVWAANRGIAVFLRREGWRDERYVLYRWDPGSARVRLLLSTDDPLTGCVAATEGTLVCVHENAVTPRQVVRIDLSTGVSTTLFDPNPEFASIDLGTVRRLKWRNDRGLEAWGDFVLPPHYRNGAKLPMIVVQYHSRGFLRGGTDDEYPIYLLAARGFAVLSLERPNVIASITPGISTATQANAANFRGWADRRSIQSSIEEGVRHAVATGTVDVKKLGITGLSDGATSVRFALINSSLFAAAALSSCCVEPVSAMTLNGPRFADYNRAMGFPAVGDTDTAFWASMSLAMKAPHLDVPLLMQLSDDEYLLGLEAFEALREHDKPVEMYVYPDEHHGKWQPAHRLAVYEHTLDWFEFWLQSYVNPDPRKAAQYRRWQAMRDRLNSP